MKTLKLLRSSVVLAALIMAMSAPFGYAQKFKKPKGKPSTPASLGARLSRSAQKGLEKASKKTSVRPTNTKNAIPPAVTPSVSPTVPSLDASVLKRQASAGNFTPVQYPMQETRPEFLARWNAMTLEEQVADQIAFEGYMQALGDNFDAARIAEYHQAREDSDYRQGLLTMEHRAAMSAYVNGKYALSPESFEQRMESDFLGLLGNTDLYPVSLPYLRSTVFARVGKEGPEHAITPQEQERYAQFIRVLLEPARVNAIVSDSVSHTPVPTTGKSAFAFAEDRLSADGIAGNGLTFFVERKTGTMGVVVEVPGPKTIIDDGVNPPQVVDPKTQVIFYANDSFGTQVAHVEERAKFEDPYAYNLVWPRPEEKLAAEQPLPANAAQPADREAYDYVRARVAEYKDKYYVPAEQKAKMIDMSAEKVNEKLNDPYNAKKEIANRVYYYEMLPKWEAVQKILKAANRE